MGDRATIHFGTSPDAIDAAIYLHWGGSTVPATLDDFFAAEAAAFEAGDRSCRFDDPSRLAARFVAWCTCTNDEGYGTRDVDGIRIVQPRSMDGTDYLVTCDGDTVPTVTRLHF